MVLGQLPQRKIAHPNHKTNPNQNPNPNQGSIFLWGNGLAAPLNPKTNPNLDRKPNPKRGAIFLGMQSSGYLFKYIYRSLFYSYYITI